MLSSELTLLDSSEYVRLFELRSFPAGHGFGKTSVKMAGSLLETTRLLHQDVEAREAKLVEILMADPKTVSFPCGAH